MLDDIAKLKDGSFYYIGDIDTLSKCFEDCVGSLVSVIAQNGTIQIKANNPA